MALRIFVCNAIYSLRVLYEITGAGRSMEERCNVQQISERGP